MLQPLTYADFLATARPIADLYGTHVEFPAEDSDGTPMPAVLYEGIGLEPNPATNRDAFALYVFAPASEGEPYTLQIGNWSQQGTLEDCTASLYAWYVAEHGPHVAADILAQVPPNQFRDGRV